MFHGYLRDLVPPGTEDIDFAVKTVKECVEAVSRQIPAFNQGARKIVQIVGVNNEHDLLREDVEVVHIVPAFAGGKRGGLIQIVLGTLLIVASIYFPPVALGAVSINAIGVSIGLSLALSGVAALLASKPASNVTSDNPEGSKYLGAQGNTVKIGTRIPLGYGRQKVYGHILSFNVSEETLADPAITSSGNLTLSQGPISLDLSRLTSTLGSAQGSGSPPYTYSLTGIKSPLSFDANTRIVTLTPVIRTGMHGGFLATYTVTDSDMRSASVEVSIIYDTTGGEN